MKRDMDLARRILLAVEAHPHGFAPPQLAVEGYDAEAIGYHNYLLIDAGLAVGPASKLLSARSPSATITKLTWAGHEFLESARDEGRWAKAKKIISDKAGPVTFEAFKAVLSGLIKSALEGH